VRPVGTCSDLDALADGDGDVVVQGDSLWFSHLSSGIEANGGLEGDLCGYDENGVNLKCFQDMGVGDVAVSMMPLRFVVDVGGKDYLYRIMFGKAVTNTEPGNIRTPVVVTRTGSVAETGSDTWNVTGISSNVSKGSVHRRAVKGKSSWSDAEYCDFYVDFDIEQLP
jgi:hypothetical protein